MKTIVVSPDHQWFEVDDSKILTITDKQFVELNEGNIMVWDLNPKSETSLGSAIAFCDTYRDKVSRTTRKTQ